MQTHKKRSTDRCVKSGALSVFRGQPKSTMSSGSGHKLFTITQSSSNANVKSEEERMWHGNRKRLMRVTWLSVSATNR